MSHLPTERLAALSDEPPTSAELAHLASCERCARERTVFEMLRASAASEQTRIGLPLTRWESLAPALRSDGVIDTGAPLRRTGSARSRSAITAFVSGRIWLQAAAVLLFVAGGVLLGRMSAGARALPFWTDGEGSASTTAIAANAASADSVPVFASVEEARLARARYELLYQTAALFLAEHDSSGYSPDNPAAMRRRLATLDEVGETVREALHESPYDPVINGYYLTTLGEREATLRQLNTALPAGVRINSF
jgi:hypothetical protein